MQRMVERELGRRLQLRICSTGATGVVAAHIGGAGSGSWELKRVSCPNGRKYEEGDESFQPDACMTEGAEGT